jgi:hypothetical protein
MDYPRLDAKLAIRTIDDSGQFQCPNIKRETRGRSITREGDDTFQQNIFVRW